ncbi:MAG: prephenate dehydrogenase/arogenate dehydrogenase family protein [Burkholderiaceae bacterium]|jgi:prephenate dehydrogenase
MKLYATLPPPQIKNLLLVGAGLIGGSLTLALKNAGVVQNVTGIGRRVEVMQHAVELGLIDRFVQPNTPEYAAAVASADVIVLAMPVGQTQAVLRDLLPHLAPHTIITDAGSTKQSVYDDARAVLGERIHQFVLAHPIAGREVNGPQAALADLYVNKKIMVCPLPQPAHNTPEQITTVVAMWQATGGLVYQMDLQAHDAIFAAVSHVPHVLAYALMNHVADSNLSDDKFAMAGAGFRDFTRIAAASPEMWRDVCLNNREAILHDLDVYLAHVQQLRDKIAASDGDEILSEFTRASEKRLAWGKEQ